jgi:hypothetical protein
MTRADSCIPDCSVTLSSFAEQTDRIVRASPEAQSLANTEGRCRNYNVVHLLGQLSNSDDP